MVSAHWSVPRARALSQVTYYKSERRIPRTMREVCDLSDEERPSNVLRCAACQSVQED